MTGCCVLRDSARRAIAICERRCPVLVDICDVDGDSNTITRTVAIGNRDGNSVGGLGFIIQSGFGLELPGGVVNTEGCGVRATDGIGQCVVVGVACGDSTPDVLPSTGILCHRTCRPIAFGETWGAVFLYICDVDRDNDCIYGTAAIRRTDSQIGVRTLRFIVERRFGLHLPGIRVNLKHLPIPPLQRIGQCIADIRVCGGEASPDVGARSRVLCNGEPRSDGWETRWFVDVADTDCDVNSVAATVAIRDRDGHRIR